MSILAETNRYGEELEKLLLLRTSPIAIKMIKTEADIPAGALRPKRDKGNHLAQCQVFAMTRRQKVTIAMLKEDNWCWAPLIAYGLVDGEIAKDVILPKGQEEIMPKLERGKYVGIVSTPLRTASFVPDLVLIYSNTTQLRIMLMAIKQESGTLIHSIFDPIDSCVYSVVPVLETGEYRITLPDPGEYERASAGEDEIILSVPLNKLGELVAGLKQLEKRHKGYAESGPDIMPDFPQPAFYRQLFHMWGLDAPD